MYSDFYDEKDDSDANLGQRSVSLVSELLGTSMYQIIMPPLTQCTATTLLSHSTSHVAIGEEECEEKGG
jgi:hypothetical protein